MPIDAAVLGINPAEAVNLDIAVTAGSQFLRSLNSGEIGVLVSEQEGGTPVNLSEDSVMAATTEFYCIALFSHMAVKTFVISRNVYMSS